MNVVVQKKYIYLFFEKDIVIVMDFEEIWEKESPIFKHEERLSIDYVPAHLPHRKEHLELLARMFTPIIRSPGSTSQKVILAGPVGTGKTAVAKRFGIELEKYSRRRDLGMRYVHINCHKDRTLFLVMKRTAEMLKLPIPPRGFSSQELMGIILNMLEDKNQYLILALDEVDYLIRTSGSDTVYDLTRLSDEEVDGKQRISLIFIMRDLTALHLLEESARSSLMHNIIRFHPYTSQQIYDILWERIDVEEAIYPSAISDDVLATISELTGVDKGGKGDARLALETLWRAGKIAEKEGRSYISIEDVRRAYSSSLVVSYIDVSSLKLHEAILLLATTKLLKRMKTARYVRLGQVEEVYNVLCEDYGIEPRRHTKLWEYVQNLKNMGILVAKISGKGFRGKSTLLEIPAIPLEYLERELEKYIAISLKQGRFNETI
ncbi:MAG: cell division control protein Cdc6 [Thermoprotei archaeon]|nr:MAG: cell division control protein Cdc6 [Thermoprotei archaeon]